MSFLYFFPGREIHPSKNSFNEADKAVGMDSILRDAGLPYINPCVGPEGQSGCMVTVDRPGFGAERLAYSADKQTWVKASDHHWLGYWNDAKPSAATLKRDTAIEGEPITINGEEWSIPVCGPAFRTLPTVWRRSGGKWVPEVETAYKGIMEECQRIIQEIRDCPQPGVDYEAAKQKHLDFCVQMLGINYHVGPEEASVLGLATESSYVQILRAANGAVTRDREMSLEKEKAATVQSG